MSLAADAPNLTLRRWANHLAIFLTLILLWELGTRSGFMNPLFYPQPSEILASFWRIYVTQGNVWFHLYTSMVLVLFGFVGGSLLGIGLGSIVGFNPTVRRFLQPYVIVLEATPRIALAPLLIAALGFGATSKIAIIILVCFFCALYQHLVGRCECG